MPNYRFHVFNDDHTVDPDGEVFQDLGAAQTWAITAARGIMADELKTKGEIDLNHWIEIEDENGDMTVVSFGDAVTVRQLLA